MKILVVGTGYVGLVTGTCFAETGVSVTCIDINNEKIEKLKNGQVPIYEPGLRGMLQRNIDKERLTFSTDIAGCIDKCDVIFICVGTPPDEDGSADLQHVLTVAKEIGESMNNQLVVATKSTVPVGTAKKIKSVIQKELDNRKKTIAFDVASNPEFLKEGNAVDDFLKPDRIIIGTESDYAKKVMQRLNKPFLLNNHPIIFMDITSAELTKYAANAMLATRISFMNDLANLCELVGADITMIRKGIGSDPRIGNKFLYAGAGYGGSCFPKDVKALIKTATGFNYSLDILKAVDTVNNRQKELMFSKIEKHFKGELKNKKIAIWGLSFKPNTDDIREAPSLILIQRLLKDGVSVFAYDPVAINEAKRILGDTITYVDDQYEALVDTDALVLMTEWPEFRVPKYKVIERLMNAKVIFDGRNIYEPEEMQEFGFTYYSFGQKN